MDQQPLQQRHTARVPITLPVLLLLPLILPVTLAAYRVESDTDDPIQFAQDAFWRVVPLSSIAWAAFTIVAVQNLLQGQRPF